MNDMTDLEVLFPESRELTVATRDGESRKVTILPFDIEQTARVLRLLRPIIDQLGEDEAITVQQLMARFPEEMVSITAIGAALPEDFVRRMRTDQGVKLAVTIFEVNVPFFAHAVVPQFATLEVMMTALLAGQKSSNNSETTGTPIPNATPPQP